jgi:ACR3 family arsenite efflux pump ArsB
MKPASIVDIFFNAKSLVTIGVMHPEKGTYIIQAFKPVSIILCAIPSHLYLYGRR